MHVWSEVAIRGASVFEGIRAYWHAGSENWYALALDEHLARLRNSAKIMRYPAQVEFEKLREGMGALLRGLAYREHAYLRPTIYLDESHGGGVGASDVPVRSYIVAFPAPRQAGAFAGIRCVVSSWRRPSDLSLSPRVKGGAVFQSLRLPRIEAAGRGADEVILLNNRETVAEASGASLFAIRDGVAITPPVAVGILEGITRRRVIELLRDVYGVSTVEREVGRTELYVADEFFLCSTLSEIQPVIEIDGYSIGDGAAGYLTAALRDHYIACCEAGPDAPVGWLTPLV